MTSLHETHRNTNADSGSAREARAISTVVDVTLALVLISASVTMLVVFMDGDDAESQPIEADRVGETTMSTTFTVTYSLEPITEHDEAGIFDSGAGTDDLPEHAFERTTHAPISAHIADAAIANITFWGERMSTAGEQYQESIDGQLRGEFTGAQSKVRIDAYWRPYDGSKVIGHAGAGPAVPEYEDVNSVTMTVPSGFEDVSDDIREVRTAGAEDFNRSARLITKAIVDGLLPPEEMQRALERQGIDRKFAAYRYDRLSRIVSEYDMTMAEGYYGTGNLEKEQVNAWHLNDRMVGNLSTSVGSVLLGNGLSEPIADEMEELFDPSIDGEELAAAVRTGEVEVLIRTWETADESGDATQQRGDND